MKYLIFPSEADAQFRNHQIAIAQGSGGVDDITQYWFGMITHQDGRAALEVDNESLLLSSEVAQLKNEDFMRNENWFI